MMNLLRNVDSIHLTQRVGKQSILVFLRGNRYGDPARTNLTDDIYYKGARSIAARHGGLWNALRLSYPELNLGECPIGMMFAHNCSP